MGYFIIYPLKTYIITCNGMVSSVNSTDIFHTISIYVIWFPQVKLQKKKHPIQPPFLHRFPCSPEPCSPEPWNHFFLDREIIPKLPNYSG